MRHTSAPKPVTAMARIVPRIRACSGLVLIRIRYGPLDVAADDRPHHAGEQRQAGRVADGGVALVHVAVEELQRLRQLVVDLRARR